MVKHTEYTVYCVSALFRTMIDEEIEEEEVVLFYYMDYGSTLDMVAIHSANDYGMLGEFVKNVDRSYLEEYTQQMLEAIDPIYGEQIPFH